MKKKFPAPQQKPVSRM